MAEESDTTEKYQVLLKFVNKILSNIGKEPIDNLTDFKEIERADIIKEENYESLVESKDEIFAHFNNKKCGWYRRSKTQTYILTFLRYALGEINLKLTYREQKKQTNGHVVSTMLYTFSS